MSSDDAQTAAAGISKLAKLLAAEPRLQPEIQRARREFFGQQAAAQGVVPGASATAEHRFTEWFALERESETLGEVPIEVLPFANLEPTVSGSLVAVVQVTAVNPDSATARDLQDDSMLDLMVPAGSLLPGDLVVGRLYSVGAGQWTPSIAAAVFRPGVAIGLAFARDAQRLSLQRRLPQVEIEHLLLRRPDQSKSPTSREPDAVPLERLEAELEQLLEGAGSELSITEVTTRLEATPRLGPAVGPLLEELAFDTAVDLDRVRALLLQIWNILHRDDEVAPAGPRGTVVSVPPGATLGEQLAQALEQGLAQKQDVDELFDQLGRMAGIDPAELEETDDLDDEAAIEASAEVGEGNLGPLVEEYLWELERTDSPAAGPLRQWAELQQNAPVPRNDIESITPSDVVRLLLHVYLAAPAGGAAAAVRATFGELRSFATWLTDTHEMLLEPVLDGCQGSFLDQLDRLQAAGDALTTAPSGLARPGLLHIEALDASGFGASDDDGADHWIAAPAAALKNLRVGDLVLGALADRVEGTVARCLTGRVVVLPLDARSLME